jgi:hypothetical protein
MDCHEISGLPELTTRRVHFLSFFPLEGHYEAVYAHSRRNMSRFSGHKDSALIHKSVKVFLSGMGLSRVCLGGLAAARILNGITSAGAPLKIIDLLEQP